MIIYAGDLHLLCTHLHEILDVPVAYLPEGDPDKGTFWGFDGRLPPHYDVPAELVRAALELHEELRSPEVRVNERLEQYLLLNVGCGQSQGLICVGPMLSHVFDDQVLLGLCRDIGIPSRDRSCWVDYYRSLPVIGRRQLLHLGAWLHWLLRGEKLDIQDVFQRDISTAPSIAAKQTDADLLVWRMQGALHPAQDVESWILECIRRGHPGGLLEFAKLAPKEGLKVVNLASRSYLRSSKNMFIAFIGACARVAVEGGLSREEAYTVTDRYIREIEDSPDVRALENTAYRAFLKLATLVQQVGEGDLSAVVRTCRDFICDHLYEEITLEQLAKLVGFSSGHLSRMFSRELGLPPMRYIRKMRIEEAKRLLALTSYSLADVAAMLRFHDQAHFTKVFKQQVGLAPGSYRRLSQQLP